MLRPLIICGLLLSSALQVWAEDAVKTDPDKYKVVLENERVRVLEYRDKPGEKTKMHTHPDFQEDCNFMSVRRRPVVEIDHGGACD